MMQVEQELMTDNKVSRQELFRQLYLDVFPKVAMFVSKRNGALEDAQDIFQDALVIFYEKSLEPDFAINTSKESYVIGIARHLWFRKFASNSKYVGLDGTDSISSTDDSHINEAGVLKLLEQTGKKCLNLLHAFYYEQLPIKQISKLLGFSSERSATVQKYKCLEKIRDTVKEKSLTHARFID